MDIKRLRNKVFKAAFFLFLAFFIFLSGIIFSKHGCTAPFKKILDRYGYLSPVERILNSLFESESIYVVSDSDREEIQSAGSQPPSPIFVKKDVEFPFTFIVLGDTQERAGIEKELIINKIIEEKPDFVIRMGDMVGNADEHQWHIFDIYDGKIIRAAIPMYPILGNHEYEYSWKDIDQPDILENYFKRFNFLQGRKWYSFTYGNCKFLMLDSNTDTSPDSYQYKWLNSVHQNS